MALIIVKLGGSLITDKARYCHANVTRIDEFGLQISQLITQGVQLIVILGGGSFGNQIPIRYNLLDPIRRNSVDIPKMTIGMQKWRELVCQRWRKLGIGVHPFQLASMLWRSDQGLQHNFSPIGCALQAGLVPLLTGDMIMSADGGIEIFSSDRLVEIIPNYVSVDRIVMLTDVDGVLHNGRVVERVNADNVIEILRSCGASKNPDVTGGMLTKVEAMWKAASMGVPGNICNGFTPQNLTQAVVGERLPGTIIDAV